MQKKKTKKKQTAVCRRTLRQRGVGDACDDARSNIAHINPRLTSTRLRSKPHAKPTETTQRFLTTLTSANSTWVVRSARKKYELQASRTQRQYQQAAARLRVANARSTHNAPTATPCSVLFARRSSSLSAPVKIRTCEQRKIAFRARWNARAKQHRATTTPSTTTARRCSSPRFAAGFRAAFDQTVARPNASNHYAHKHSDTASESNRCVLLALTSCWLAVASLSTV